MKILSDISKLNNWELKEYFFHSDVPIPNQETETQFSNLSFSELTFLFHKHISTGNILRDDQLILLIQHINRASEKILSALGNRIPDNDVKQILFCKPMANIVVMKNDSAQIVECSEEIHETWHITEGK